MSRAFLWALIMGGDVLTTEGAELTEKSKTKDLK